MNDMVQIVAITKEFNPMLHAGTLHPWMKYGIIIGAAALLVISAYVSVEKKSGDVTPDYIVPFIPAVVNGK